MGGLWPVPSRPCYSRHNTPATLQTGRSWAVPPPRAGRDETLAAIDVAAIIDEQRISGFQGRIVLMAWLTLFLDGIDNQAIAYVAPALSASWPLERGALGPVFAAGVVGVALGALIIGPLADRYGRKRVLISTVVYFSAVSLAITQARDLSELLVLRFLIGLGLGAVVPLAVVLVNEFAPRRRRAAVVAMRCVGCAV